MGANQNDREGRRTLSQTSSGESAARQDAPSDSTRAMAMVDAPGKLDPHADCCDSELCRAWQSLGSTDFDRVSRMREVESRLRSGASEATGLEYQPESVTGGYSWATENATRAVKSLERRDSRSREDGEGEKPLGWQEAIFTATIMILGGWTVIALAIRIVEALQ